MNNPNIHTNPAITLEDIVRMKAEKLEEIRASKGRIRNAAQDLFRPKRTDTDNNVLMNNVSSGIAIFNGIMTGFRIINRIRKFFQTR